MRAYLLLNGDGDVLGGSESRDEAIEAALSIADEKDVFFDGATETEEAILRGIPADLVSEEPLALAANRLSAWKSAPGNAMRALQKGGFQKPSWDDVESMSLAEAYKILAPYFPRTKRTRQGIRPVQAYQTPEKMAVRLLGQNMKIGKDAPPRVVRALKKYTGFSEASITGLSLLPNNMAYSSPMVADILAQGKRSYGLKVIDHANHLLPGRQPVRANLCTKATAECIAACLTFSGQNLNDDYNTIKKFALTQSLMRETTAFVRMLAEAVSRHEKKCIRAGKQPLIRLNVYSDIPWELACPELFQKFSDTQFYDYTKVPGRDPEGMGISNYDITFSFSGTKANVEEMEHEIRQMRRRVAVVFAARGLATRNYFGRSGEVRVPKGEALPIRVEGYRKKARETKAKPFAARFVEPFLGLQVIDGDESDLRPYDPAPSIVGLRWKPPQSQAVTWSQAQVFVVEVQIVESGKHFDAIIAKTPRFDEIDFSDVADSD